MTLLIVRQLGGAYSDSWSPCRVLPEVELLIAPAVTRLETENIHFPLVATSYSLEIRV